VAKKQSAEKAIKEIGCKTRRRFSAEATELSVRISHSENVAEDAK